MHDGKSALLPPIAWADALVAITMTAATLWFLHIAHVAAIGAVRRYGENIDSGWIVSAAAIYYCAPNAVLWALASFGMWRRWETRWIAQGFAIFWAGVPVILASVPWWKR
jgi:hypothetical protein